MTDIGTIVSQVAFVASMGAMVFAVGWTWVREALPWRRVRGKGEGAWGDFWTPPCATCKKLPKKCPTCKWHNLWPTEEYAGWRHLEDGEIRSIDHGDCYCKARYSGGEVEFLVGACRKGDTTWVVQYLKRATPLPTDEVWWKLGQKVKVTPQRANRPTRKCIDDIMDGYAPEKEPAMAERTWTKASFNGAELQGATLTFSMDIERACSMCKRCPNDWAPCPYHHPCGSGHLLWEKREEAEERRCETCKRRGHCVVAPGTKCGSWQARDEYNGWRHLEDGEVLSFESGDVRGQVRCPDGELDVAQMRRRGDEIHVEQFVKGENGELVLTPEKDAVARTIMCYPSDQIWWKRNTAISGGAIRREPERMMGGATKLEEDIFKTAARAAEMLPEEVSKTGNEGFFEAWAAAVDRAQSGMPGDVTSKCEDMIEARRKVEEFRQGPGEALRVTMHNGERFVMTVDEVLAWKRGQEGGRVPQSVVASAAANAGVRKHAIWARGESEEGRRVVRFAFVNTLLFGVPALCQRAHRWAARPRSFVMQHRPDRVERETARDIRWRGARGY